jgi:IS30 family transposase
MRKYQRLSNEQRQKLSFLLGEGRNQRQIGESLNVHQSTISRELKRHRQRGVYNPINAQFCCDAKRTAKRKRTVLTPKRKKEIRFLLAKHWSPEQIAGRMTLEGKKISCDSVYRMVKEDRESGGTLYLRLRRKGKPYRKRGYRSSGRGLIPNRVPIDQRPAEVESKKTFGHWEADTIVSRGRQGGFLTLVERKTKYTFVFPIQSRRSEEIEEKMKMLQSKSRSFQSITFDNGKEFSKHVDFSRVLKTNCYFANPYHSWERGLNEPPNGLIREFFRRK